MGTFWRPIIQFPRGGDNEVIDHLVKVMAIPSLRDMWVAFHVKLCDSKMCTITADALV